MAEPVPPLRQSVRVLKRQRWLVVLPPVVAIAATAFLAHRQQPVYRASMGIVVAQASGPYLSPLGNQPLTQTIRGMLQSDVVARAVIQKLHLPVSTGGFLGNLTVQSKPDSSVLEVSYDASSKAKALDVVSEVQLAFQDLVRKTLGVTTNFKQKGALLVVASVFDPPHVAASPVAPRPGRLIAFAGVLGLALGLILAFARETLDDRIRDTSDAEEWFGAPLIGVFPAGRRGLVGSRQGLSRTTHGIGWASRNGKAVDDAVGVLTANVQLRSREIGHTLLVTSAAGDDATPEVVANIGVALALAGQDVLCVDTRFSDARLERLLLNSDGSNVDRQPGLTGVLEGSVELERAVREVAIRQSDTDAAPRRRQGRLLLLPPGSSPPDPAVFSPTRLSETVSALSAKADYVLFDCPPLLSTAYAISLASAVTGVVVVARQGQTRRERAEELRAALSDTGARNVAVVLLDKRT